MSTVFFPRSRIPSIHFAVQANDNTYKAKKFVIEQSEV